MLVLYRGRQVLCLEIIQFLLHQHHSLKAKQKKLDLFKDIVQRWGWPKHITDKSRCGKRVHRTQWRKLHVRDAIWDHKEREVWDGGKEVRPSVERVILPTSSQPEWWPPAKVMTFDTEHYQGWKNTYSHFSETKSVKIELKHVIQCLLTLWEQTKAICEWHC